MYSRYEQRRNCCNPRQREKPSPQKQEVQLPKEPPSPSPCSHRKGTGREQNRGRPLPAGFFPPALSGLLSGSGSGDLMALMILLLLLWEGKEDSRGTILTLLIFLLL